MGLRSFTEFLSFIPGIFVQSSNIPMDSIMVRGISESFNQKILLLIDDVPYWGASHSQIPLHGIPLEAIDHIEVIRGPGAVIYGTNASAGVIKVVTKKGLKDNSFAIRGGSYNHFNNSGYYSTSISDSVDLSVGFEFQNESGYPGFFENSVTVPFATGTSGNIRKKVNKKSILFKLNAGNLNILAQAYESLEGGSLGAAPTHPEKPALFENNGQLLHADYHWNLNDSKIKVYGDYNMAYIEAWESNFQPGLERRVKFVDSEQNNYRLRGGMTLNHQFSNDLSFFVGGEYERRSVGQYDLFIGQKLILTQLKEKSANEKNVFAQVDYTLNQFRFLIGGRYIDNENAGSAFTPRVAAIYSINPSQSIKLLYSEGFNSPNFLQTDVNLPFIVGNKNLKAEIVSTIDLAYTYASQKSLLVLNAFELQTKDVITRVGTVVPTYDNSGAFKRYGLELDFQYRQNKFSGFFNLSYLNEGKKIIDNDLEARHTPGLTGNIAMHTNILGVHGVGTSLRYIGSRSGISHHYLWNVDYQYQFNHAELFVSIRNLLSKDAYSRDVAGFSPEPVPVSDPDTNFLVGVKFYY